MIIKKSLLPYFLALTATVVTGGVCHADAPLKILHSFGTTNDGSMPYSLLRLGNDGKIYGTTSTGGLYNLGTVYSMNPDGTNYTVLHSFNGNDGSTPYTGVTANSAGTLYGMTYAGGILASGATGGGVIYTIDGTGNFNIVHTFDPNTEGNASKSDFTLGSDGALYGAVEGISSYFKIAPDGTYSVTCSNITSPYACPFNPIGYTLEQADHSFLGIATIGLSAAFGSIYHQTSDGEFTTLYTFNGNQNGLFPNSSPTLAQDGYIYATTASGGMYGGGTLFRILPDGNNFSVVHSFSLVTDVNGSQGALLASTDGSLYGTGSGSATAPLFGGGIYRLNPDQSYQPLYLFTGSDGLHPFGSLFQTADGTILGTTTTGGANNAGEVFSFDPVAALIPQVIIKSATSSSTSAPAQITLTWAPPAWQPTTNISSYNLYMGTSPGGEASSPIQSNLTGSQVSIPGLTYGKTYYFTMVALDANGNPGPVSNEMSAAAAQLPSITSFYASQYSITLGQSIQLTWGSQYADTCSASGSWSGAEPISGQTQITPTSAGQNQFSLTCSNAYGQTKVTISVTVTAIPPSGTLSSSPSTINLGNSSTLTWAIANANSCSATGAWAGTKSTAGQEVVTPSNAGDNLYNLTCTGPGGQTTYTADVYVVSPTPTATLSINVPYVRVTEKHQQPVLTWASTNATACYASGDWTGTLPTSGTMAAPLVTSTTLKPATTDTYSIYCTGPGGNSQSQSVNLTVYGK